MYIDRQWKWFLEEIYKYVPVHTRLLPFKQFSMTRSVLFHVKFSSLLIAYLFPSNLVIHLVF